MRLALKILYLGSRYNGWQRQPNVVTVEGAFLKALTKTKVLNDLNKGKYGYASRTDAFVHGLSQIVAFNALEVPDVNQINDLLPSDVCVVSICKVSSSFHPRYDFNQKTYRYLAPYDNEDLDSIKKAAQFLKGTHDFSSFAKTSPNHSNITTITDIDITRRENLLIFDFLSSRGFLWQQVRRMVTFFTSCGQGEISPDETSDYLKVMKLPKVPPASPHRLILLNVSFQGIFFEPLPEAISKFREYLDSEIPLTLTPIEVINEFKKYLDQPTSSVYDIE